MAQVAITPEQLAQLQAEVQQELERREWAEPDDNVMAEYITVLLANGSTKDRVHTEMDDLVGSDFDPRFLDWLFDVAASLTSSRRSPSPAPARSPSIPTHPSSSNDRDTRGGGSRILNSALAPLAHPEKRKFDDRHEGQNKKRLSDGIPSGPRGMGNEGRSLADRLGPGRGQPGGGRGGMQVRGLAGPPPRQNGMGMGGFQGQGFRPQPGMMQPGFGGFFPPGQQEMMAQMMMMQANMAQMGEMMQQMVHEKDSLQAQNVQQPVRPARPPPAKIPHGTKLGSHAVSAIQPKKSAAPGPIPDKPSSTALCRYSVGCSNSRCPYSHPSPVADEKTGMVLSEEPCEQGKNCKDAECTKSHVSPAAILGETAGPSRMLCKYLNCTNPSCAFRHEDENGNPIPPPALTAAKAAKEAKKVTITAAESNPAASDGEDGDVEVVVSSKSLMDGPLGEGKVAEKSCRYGERCTRPDCKFTHPASRPNPKTNGKKFGAGRTSLNGGGVGGGGMNKSKKFGAAAAATETKLNPTVGEFKPAPAATEVTGE